MKYFYPFCVALLLTHATTTLAQELASEQQQMSYMIGLQIGDSIKELPLEFDIEALALAIKHSLENSDKLLTQEQLENLRNELSRKMQQEALADTKAKAEQNLVASNDFLAENKNRDGVTVTESGLQYEIVKAADGAKPAAEDTVTVHYKGTLLDGTEFDSSYSRGQPATFQLNKVIPGWTEGVQLMNVGSTYRFYIPPALGYGERGAGQNIGPNSALIFDVELIEIKK